MGVIFNKSNPHFFSFNQHLARVSYVAKDYKSRLSKWRNIPTEVYGSDFSISEGICFTLNRLDRLINQSPV